VAHTFVLHPPCVNRVSRKSRLSRCIPR
jgi:hypothetical protein